MSSAPPDADGNGASHPSTPAAGRARLERSRLAILQHIVQREQRGQPAQDTRMHDPVGYEAAHEQATASLHAQDDSWWSQANGQLQRWWHAHPGRMALDLARPALVSYARRQPLRYLGIAAAGGAAVLLMRPWKLISVTGVLVALVKSPQVLGMAMNALTRGRNPAGDEQPPH